jgi:putative exosortase-associated protein (TIGR04073 family)
MKKLMTTAVAAVFVLGFACWSFGYETDFDDLHQFDRNLPGWKLGRGVVNILSAPHEFFANVTNNAIRGAHKGAYYDGLHGYVMGSLNGFIAGIGPGVSCGFRRMTTGALEILTFWKPEYGPTVDPEYGTHNRAFGDRDYYNPKNFWYNGPD